MAGNSFITVRHTSAAATPTPGAASRNVTVVHTVHGRRPRVRAASSIDGDTWVIELRMAPSAKDKNSTTYANTSIGVRWYSGVASRMPKKTMARATTMPGRL